MPSLANLYPRESGCSEEGEERFRLIYVLQNRGEFGVAFAKIYCKETKLIIQLRIISFAHKIDLFSSPFGMRQISPRLRVFSTYQSTCPVKWNAAAKVAFA